MHLSERYESIVLNSKIASPGLVKGTLFIHAKGWHIWESIRSFMDAEYGAIGIRNVAFPALIPVAEIEKEKEELNGFKPELFLVTKTGEEARNSIFLRPTSEILFSHFFKRELTSYGQLPMLLNQWCNVYRSEKNTKAFLRSCEFYWQEAHTLHSCQEEALDYLERLHAIYRKMVGDLLNLVPLVGEKTVNERFQGSNKTLTLEVIMPDGQALQIATTHYLGQNFTGMFKVTYTDHNNTLQNPHQLSAGSSTRLIGALIMGHSDETGLVMPFGVADVQIKILVMGDAVKEGDDIYRELEKLLKGYRVEWELTSKKSFGFRIADAEVAGIPVAIMIGKKELEKGQVLVKSRISGEKVSVNVGDVAKYIGDLEVAYAKELMDRGKRRLEEMVVDLTGGADLERVKSEVLDNKKVALVPWFDDEENEERFKREGLGFGPRCIRNRISQDDVKCFYSGQSANSYVYFGRSY